MPQFGISVEKDTLFRGVQQPFSNIYHYRVLDPTGVNWGNVVDELVALEKTWHATVVNFRYVRVWSSGGTKEDNKMVFEKQLTGVGATTPIGEMDRERAVLMRWPAGFSKTGKPVYLRKWYHTCGNTPGVTFGAAVLANTAELSAAQRSSIATEMNKVRLIGAVDEFLLVAASGREHTGPGECHKFLEHHQLGDQWR